MAEAAWVDGYFYPTCSQHQISYCTRIEGKIRRIGGKDKFNTFWLMAMQFAFFLSLEIVS